MSVFPDPREQHHLETLRENTALHARVAELEASYETAVGASQALLRTWKHSGPVTGTAQWEKFDYPIHLANCVVDEYGAARKDAHND